MYQRRVRRRRLTADHRWAVGFRIAVLYGLRRSELLALRWDDLDLKAATLRIDERLVPVVGGTAWTDAKNARSRRLIPLDAETIRSFGRGVAGTKRWSASSPARPGRIRTSSSRPATDVRSCREASTARWPSSLETLTCPG